MNSQLAYEIGAVFLLAALLMFGSVRGFSGRFRLGGGTMVALGVALVAFGVYHYWDTRFWQSPSRRTIRRHT